jgi:hypothetical protein
MGEVGNPRLTHRVWCPAANADRMVTSVFLKIDNGLEKRKIIHCPQYSTAHGKPECSFRWNAVDMNLCLVGKEKECGKW